MSTLDVRTILIGFVASDVVCTLVIASLWRGHRRRWPEIEFWAAGFALQTIALLLIALRGIVPDLLSIVVGNGLGATGIILLFIGLKRHMNQPGPQVQNWVMLGMLMTVQTYFGIIHPILAIRTIGLSCGILFISIQSAWLMLRRAEPRLRPTAKQAGAVFCVYALTSVIRIGASLVMIPGNDFLRSGTFDALILMVYQVLFIALTFSLFFMVNRRLSMDLEDDIIQRRQVEKKLRDSEEKFSLAFQNMPDAVTLTSMDDGILLDVNESFTDLTGYSREETVGRTALEMNLWQTPEDRSRFVSLLKPEGHVQNLETAFCRKSGEPVTAQISGQILRLPQGTCILSIIRDITERKQAEQAIQESEHRYHSTLDSMMEGCQIIGFDWRYLYVNAAAARHGHGSREAMVGHTMMERYPGIETTAMFAVLRKCMQERVSESIENEFTYPDGSKGWFELSIQPVAEGIFVLSADITQRIKLQREVMHMASFPAHSPYAVVEIDCEGSVLFANPSASAALARLGLNPDARQFMPGTPEELRRMREQCLEAPRTDELILGTATFLRVMTALPSETSLRLYAIDITERKKMEEEIRTLNTELDLRVRQRTAELVAANKELEAFSYSVSHDLRAPLRSIDGFSQAFLEDYGAAIPEEGREDLERVRKATQRMGHLIDDMLMLSRVTRSVMHRQMVDMSALSAEVADDLMRSNPQRDVQLTIEPDMTAIGDRQLLHIVMDNLLNNAWKFTSRREHAHISIGTVHDPERGPAFFVRDNGAGFDPRYGEKLFVAFQRLHAQEEFPGTGIGLATVQRAVRRHGGEVWAEGATDQGATFYFTIPDLQASIPVEEGTL